MRTSTTQGPPSADERTVRIARKRFARRQWARRWLAWRRLLVVLVAVALVAGTVWLVFFSSALTVKGVDIRGIDVLRTAEVRRVAAVPVGEPLARVPVEAIEARVQSLAPVKTVDVSRSWPDRVRIAVVERQAVAVVERDGIVRGVDDEGVLFRSYPTKPPGLPVIRMSAATPSDALAGAAEVIAVLPEQVARRVDYLSVATVDSISLRLRDGRSIFWGSAQDSESKARVLAVLFRQKASVYDVSVPGQPTIER